MLALFQLYPLQTNGLTERFNQTLSRCLAKIVNESQSDWDDKIDTDLMGYRASRQSSTKFSPYYMMFQQEMRLPIDTEFLPSDLDAEKGDAETVDHTIEYLLSTRQTVFQKADSNIASAQKHQKETYDRKHQPQQIAEGTEVLLENTYHKQRKGGKMNPVWLGPYTISRHIGKGLYAWRGRC